jgi:hypothetical protein
MISAYNSRSTSALIAPSCPSPHGAIGGRARMAIHKPIPSFDQSRIDEFWSLVDRRSDAECWLWRGASFGKVRGYGSFYHNYAHRVAYTLARGPIPDGLTIDHLCRTHRCVNPAHLEAVTSKENTLRGFGKTAVQARKTHCRAGHPLTGDNVRTYGKTRKSRVCVTCWLERKRRVRAFVKNKREKRSL